MPAIDLGKRLSVCIRMHRIPQLFRHFRNHHLAGPFTLASLDMLRE